MDRLFEAPDLIDVMEEAVNYNSFLITELLAWSQDTETVLDFGAGSGRFSRALQEQRRRVHAVEPDPILQKRVQRHGIPCHVSLDAVGNMRFRGIYSINVLEHIEDDRGILAAIRQRLEPGGRLFLYVPAFPILYSANDERVGHVRRYRKQALLGALAATGFRVDAASYVDSIGFAAGLWYRLFGDRDGLLDARAVRLYDRAVFPTSRRLDAVLGGRLGKNLLVRATRQEFA